MAEDTPAQRAAALRDTMPQPPIAVDDGPPPTAPLGAVGERMRPQPVRSRRGWTWLVVALVIFVLLVGGGGYAGWRYLQSGYFVGDDHGNVAIFQGSPDGGVLGIGSPKVKERANPPVLVADLPPADQDSVRQNIEGIDDIGKARDTVNRLRAELCAYSIGVNGNQVVIFKGRGQPRCGNGAGGQIVPGTQRLEFKALPGSQQNAVRKIIKVSSRQEADTRLNLLVNAARECAADPSSSQDCPRKKSS